MNRLGERAAELDAHNPLAQFHDRFVVAEPELCYLDGNSLGRLPRATAQRLATVVGEEWGRGLIRSWDDWIDRAAEVGDRLGVACLGAAPGAGETVIADSTTINLHKAVRAAVAARPRSAAIAVDPHEFPTDRYVVASVATEHGLVVRHLGGDPVEGPSPQDVEAVLGAGDVGVLVLSIVGYRSGALVDVAAVEEVAARSGTIVVWDASHAVGAVPIDLGAAGAALCVGCTYKHLHGGPGAPAFLWVSSSRAAAEGLRNPLPGWFAHADQFGMADPFEAVSGAAGWLSGTSPVLALAAVDEGVALIEQAGIDAVRAVSLSLGRLAQAGWAQMLAPRGVDLGSPAAGTRRGGHLSVTHAAAAGVAAAMREMGVVPDFRTPTSIRLGFAALSTTHADVVRGIGTIADVIDAGAHLGRSQARVT